MKQLTGILALAILSSVVAIAQPLQPVLVSQSMKKDIARLAGRSTAAAASSDDPRLQCIDWGIEGCIESCGSQEALWNCEVAIVDACNAAYPSLN